ncbi:MAG: hypothetical protein ABI686_06355 [Acidobacteriota bacterium]
MSERRGNLFMFAPKFHPSLRRVGDVRRSLGIRTCLNLLGILSNPAGAPKQTIGVLHPSLIELMAKSPALLGIEKAWVVHGSDGLDEITLTGKTFVAEVSNGKVKNFSISTKDFGLQSGEIKHLKVETAEQSATIIKEILASKHRDEARSLVGGGISKEPMPAARLAEQRIDSHSAQVKLERLIQTINRKS